VEKRVGPCVSLVFREIKPDSSACHRDEPWQARLELVLPLLVEAKPLVPGDSASGILDIEDRDDLFFHASSGYPEEEPKLARASVPVAGAGE
jgi:hypothetical protein